MPTRAVGSVPGRNHQDKKNNKEEQQRRTTRHSRQKSEGNIAFMES
jgi:hypothetical protein